MNKRIYLVLSTVILAILIVKCVSLIKEARASKSDAPCVVRLLVISGCKAEWALENHKSSNDEPQWRDIYAYLPTSWTNNEISNGIPICPEGGVYTLGKIGELPKCSIGGKYHSIPGH